MKIEFLDVKMTEAKLTKGFLWWKKEAFVFESQQVSDIYCGRYSNFTEIRPWAFSGTGYLLPINYSYDIYKTRCKIKVANELKDREGKEWVRPTPIPKALAYNYYGKMKAYLPEGK